MTTIINRSMLTDAKAAYEAAKDAYESAKEQMVLDMVCMMRETGQRYTAAELADITGFPKEHITNILCNKFFWTNDLLRRIGCPKIVTEDKVITETYVRVLEDGSIDREHMIRSNRRVNVYRIIKR